MGYELHFCRTAHWWEAEEKPLERGAWDALVAEAELVTPVPESAAGEEPTLLLPRWGDAGPALQWDRGRVRVYGASEAAHRAELVRIAERLQVFLVGDEGEIYDASAPDSGYLIDAEGRRLDYQPGRGYVLPGTPEPAPPRGFLARLLGRG